METRITFIIPSINRETLSRTIDSLFKQSNPNWKAIIIFDGVKNDNLIINDNRISIMHIEKIGKKNNAGEVRNIGISNVSTEWCGFVDDDDIITCDYVKLFYEYIINEPYLDVIQFRMKNINIILPEKNENNIILGKIGISFCVKTDILKIFKFIPSDSEDFYLIDKLNKAKKKIMISDKVTYAVRNTIINENDNTKNNFKKDYYNL